MKTIYRLLFYLALTSILRAEESGDSEPTAQRTRISLREVTSVVLANNPAIQKSLRKWGAAKARVTQEVAWDDLKVSGNSRAARFVDVAPNAFTDQMVSVEQVIPLTGKNLVRARIAAADAPLGALGSSYACPDLSQNYSNNLKLKGSDWLPRW